MASTSPIVFIIGAGANVGQHVARAFAAKGYKVAVGSRSTKDQSPDQLHVPVDVSDPESVPGAFEKVKEALGIPSVVVYNAAAASFRDAENPLSLPLSEFNKDLAINTTSVYVAAHHAVQGFQQLPDSASKTFIYTGNALNTTIFPPLLTLGVGKSATAHIIQFAASAYNNQGFKFYFADERRENGAPVAGDINGEAHGVLYQQLAEGKEQGPWQQTFVKGIGYKKF